VRTYNKCRSFSQCSKGVMVRADSANAYVPGKRTKIEVAKMADEQFDLIVVGGGPGGSTIATLVAKRGHRVLLLEREELPRYQIGESTLPYTLGICKILGVGDDLAQAGFTQKLGGVWRWGSRGNLVHVDFREVVPEPLIAGAYAYQVERMKFDKLLLDNARRMGVDVRERHSVLELIVEDGRVMGAKYADCEGREGAARARYVADAGGNTSTFHRMCGQRIWSDKFRNFALFGYYEGGKRLPPPMSGSILNVTFEFGWFWYIPLAPALTSVGAVVPVGFHHMLDDGRENAMERFIEACPKIKQFLEGTQRIKEGTYGQLRVRKDWSYCNTGFCRPGLVLIGDAACFVDPLFSSGIHLSTYSALLAARSINSILQNASGEGEYLNEFETRYRNEYAKFYEFLATFYKDLEQEEYFRRASEILQTEEPGSNALVRLVSGWSADGEELDKTCDGRAEETQPPRTLAEKSFGNAFAKSEADIFDWAIKGVPSMTRAKGLVPTDDGLAWTQATARKVTRRRRVTEA
jgi:halogenation protein CepH